MVEFTPWLFRDGYTTFRLPMAHASTSPVWHFGEALNGACQKDPVDLFNRLHVCMCGLKNLKILRFDPLYPWFMIVGCWPHLMWGFGRLITDY